MSALFMAGTTSAATLAPTTTCSNGVDDTPGLGLICEVTIVNRITPTGGSATVTVRECHGAAGDPQAACTVTTSVLTAPVTQVTQCNAATNGGGGTLRCSVSVTNHFTGVAPGATAATVNQCVGSGGGITIGCNPFPATTTGATITQCNGSANGGTLVGLTCTATGTESSAFAVGIDQCNGSTNGGGALVICSADISNIVLAAPTPTPTTTPRATARPTARPTAKPTPRPVVARLATPRPAAKITVGAPAGSPRVSSPTTSTEIVAPIGTVPTPVFASLALLLGGIVLLSVGFLRGHLRGNRHS